MQEEGTSEEGRMYTMAGARLSRRGGQGVAHRSEEKKTDGFEEKTDNIPLAF